MKFKTLSIVFSVFVTTSVFANEPFVVLDYNGGDIKNKKTILRKLFMIYGLKK